MQAEVHWHAGQVLLVVPPGQYVMLEPFPVLKGLTLAGEGIDVDAWKARVE